MHSLRRRLTLTHTLVALLAVLLVALLASGLIVRVYRGLARQQAEQQAQATSQRLGALLARYYVANRGWRTVEADLRQSLVEQPWVNDQRVILVGVNERVLFDSAGELRSGQPLPLLLRRQPSAPVQAPERGVVGRVVAPISIDAQLATERTFVRSITAIVIVGSLVAGGAALLVALLVARQLTRPLRSLTLAARRLAAGERHQPLATPAGASGELGELAHAFNSMAADLARHEDLRRQLVADIAHELRTPLSVLRLQVESLEDGVEQPSPPVLNSLSHQVNLLARLVDDLRLLSIADAGQLALALESLDPQTVLERAAAAAAPRARQQQIDLRVERNGALPAVRADPQRLAQVLGNLVENALRYTPAGGSVTLRANQTQPTSAPAPCIVFEIADTGPGIPPDDLPHIFNRFYRTDRARARDTGGTGLGLAIVQRLVEAHGGQVSVASAPGAGAVFRVALPADATK